MVHVTTCQNQSAVYFVTLMPVVPSNNMTVTVYFVALTRVVPPHNQLTLSSLRFLPRQTALSAGSPEMPNWATRWVGGWADG